MKKINHYVYKVTLPETGEMYIGVRSCKCDIMNDNYKGSMKTWKVDKTKLVKEIISTHETRKLANEAEKSLLILELKEKKNKLCKNAYITDVGFHVLGVRKSEESKKKISDAKKGIKRDKETVEKMRASLKGKPTWNKGKKTGPLSDEHKYNISKGCKGRVGYFMTDEIRNRISISVKKYYKEKEKCLTY